MPTHPHVSICIPSYNAVAYLRTTILSILSQTYQDYEIVILDDASTDGTMDAIRDIKDPRIRRYSNETNLGGGGNWNKAVRLARGNMIKVLCSDDLLYPRCLEKQVRILEDLRWAKVGLVSCWRNVIDEDGRRILSRKPSRMKGFMTGSDALRRIIRSGTNPVGEPAAVLFRRELLERAGPFDGSNPFVLDIDMWCRMLLYSGLFALPEELCAFRVSAASWSVHLARGQSLSYRNWLFRISRDPRYGLSRWDVFLGLNKSRGLNLARMLFYKRFANRRGQ